MRELSYKEAIREALRQAMKKDKGVFVFGEGVDDSTGIFGTALELQKEFGKKRVFDIPIAENGLTGAAIGAAIAGLRPVMVHQRTDFLLMSMDQIVNQAAKWSYMTGGRVSVPLVIRSIIGRGWGQGVQHSQSLQALFMHIPGLKVVMPATPYDAKGLLLSSIKDNNPVIFIEHRWLYDKKGNVPKEMYTVPLGKGKVVKEGNDVTIVAVSLMAVEALEAAKKLEKEGISAEIIDPRTLAPLDEEIILKSVKKTGRLIIADTGWLNCGVGAEISARVSEKAFEYLKAPIKRIGLRSTPTPSSPALEKEFYPTEEDIILKVKSLVRK